MKYFDYENENLKTECIIWLTTQKFKIIAY